MAKRIWNTKMTVEESLELPEGRFAADVGMWVEQSVEPRYTGQSAEALIEAGESANFYTQAELIVKAKEKGLAFEDWMPLRLI